ncbi:MULTISPECIES: TlpA disulfide reductase family protein [Methylomonas]|uniref:Thioredoxin n=2 Tax=Methylomonas TaxID=416 RepID=A0A126T6A6_9GAMM|nr:MULTISPECIES: TlpA disulfide reductase family protein [Methylomonas]AMK77611.1 thioredoxin [Methylomonas denitrificans]OAH96893.1 thioredoxin [Methylomonas methanica]TCV86780.1 peroxiredoxin [Methylomonas methanica]
MRIKSALGVLSVICLLGAVAWWLTYTKSFAPHAVFTTLKGERLTIAELKGKPVLITFWATDCPSCIEEIPDLIALHQQFNEKGLQIIAVAMPYDPPSRVQALAKERQLPYAVALDIDSSLVRAFSDVQLTPTTFLIDRQGVIIMHKVGAFDLLSLKALLAQL